MNVTPQTVLLIIALVLSVVALLRPAWPLLPVAVILVIVAVWIH